MAKVIMADNFDRDCWMGDDILVAESVPEEAAEKIVNQINKSYVHGNSHHIWKVKPDDYQLQKFEP